MKSIYVKPETEIVSCTLLGMIAESGNGTEWNMGDDPIGDDEPDPNKDAKRVHNLWED